MQLIEFNDTTDEGILTKADAVSITDLQEMQWQNTNTTMDTEQHSAVLNTTLGQQFGHGTLSWRVSTSIMTWFGYFLCATQTSTFTQTDLRTRFIVRPWNLVMACEYINYDMVWVLFGRSRDGRAIEILHVILRLRPKKCVFL